MTRLAFDMSSYLKTSLLAGKDHKDGILVMFEDQSVLVNSAEYGYENVVNMMVKTFNDCGLTPKDAILVFEGMNSKSRRLLIDTGYKGKRDQRPPEFYEEFKRLRDYVEEVFKDMGAIAMVQDYVEGDDVLAWLARETEEDLIIASRDNDVGVCITEANAHGAKVRFCNDGLFDIVMLSGVPFTHPYKYITLYKALVGDSSDSIKGVTGFGPAKFQKLAEQYGYEGLDELMSLLAAGKLDPLHEMAEDKEHKLVKMIVEQEKDAVKSWKLARMYPEWINTMARPIQVRAGKVAPQPDDADERLVQWYGKQYLVAQNEYLDALVFFKEQLALTAEPTFDIETSTPDESDDWIAAMPKKKDGKGVDFVDQLGSVLTGFSFTFGRNMEHTMYVSVDHADTENISMSQARKLIECAIETGKPIIIQNNFFELSVLSQAEDEDGTKWLDAWEKYGAHGFIPNTLDTKIEANYVDENMGTTSLKPRSKVHLGYDQQTFQQTTHWTGPPDSLPKGGRLIVEHEDGAQTRQYKMRELTAEHVFNYGCDDTICTYALHNFYKLMMQLEHHWQVYLDVEIDASYQHVKNFIDGTNFSLEKMRELEAIDDETFDAAWTTVRAYLISKGWQGTVPPTYTSDITAAQIKEAYTIVKGAQDDLSPQIELAEADPDAAEEADESSVEEPEEQEADAFLTTKVRTPAKLVAMLRELGHDTFAGMVVQCQDGEAEKFTSWVREHYKGEPLFKASNKQMCKLLYEVMALPIQVRNKPTAKMRAEGKQGNPKGDVLALDYALRDTKETSPEVHAVLESIKLMRMVMTRRSLYYAKYPYFMHWKTGRLHSTHNQAATNTRRASEASPNKQQQSKHPKITGQPARFRETIVPHHEDAVIVSLDFDSQELRVIADYSKDANLVACFVGENKKGMHSLTGHMIAVKKKKVPIEITYEEFDKAAKDKNHPLFKACSEYRALGKKVNFTTEFGAMAPKLAMTMLVSEAEAQVFIDAKEAMFPGVRVWKDATIAEAKRVGIVRTMEGAVRHLGVFFTGDDHWLKSKAERQAVNFKVQGSSAEMTKKAEGRMWRTNLVYMYDCVCIGPIHDEVVFSVAKKDLEAFAVDAHWCMTQPYGGMTIPIESSISFGPSFGEQVEIGIVPSAEAIAKGWKEIAEMKKGALA